MFKHLAIGILSIIATFALLVLMAILDEPTPTQLPPPIPSPTIKQNEMIGGCVYQQTPSGWVKTCG